MIKRGDIFYADFPGSDGHVQGFGRRPWLVVQNNKGNAFSQVTIVVPITKKYKRPLPVHVKIHGEQISGTVLCEQIRAVDNKQFKAVEHLSDEDMKKVDEALAISLGLKDLI